MIWHETANSTAIARTWRKIDLPAEEVSLAHRSPRAHPSGGRSSSHASSPAFARRRGNRGRRAPPARLRGAGGWAATVRRGADHPIDRVHPIRQGIDAPPLGTPSAESRRRGLVRRGLYRQIHRRVRGAWRHPHPGRSKSRAAEFSSAPCGVAHRYKSLCISVFRVPIQVGMRLAHG